MKNLFYILLLISCIYINNHIYGMKQLLYNDTTCLITPEKSYFEDIPQEVIEKVAACCDQKNTLMKINKFFNVVCSKNNADNILIHHPLILENLDKEYFAHAYVKKNNLEMVKLLLEHKANINSLFPALDGLTLLYRACKKNYFDIINLLLMYGADVNKKTKKDGDRPLIIACKKNYLIIVKLLLERGADANSRNRYYSTPLMAACCNGNLDIVNLLFKYKATVNYHDTKLLHIACKKNCLEIVRLLLGHGVNVDLISRCHGSTSLYKACKRGYTPIVRLLLEYGADVNLKNYHGITPLHKASQNSDCNLTQILLEHEADVNIANKYNSTPLHWACASNKLNNAILLIKYGARVYLKNWHDETPLQIAQRLNHSEIVNFIKEWSKG